MISMAADETFNQLESDRKKILIHLLNENKCFLVNEMDENESDNESTKILEQVNYYVCIPQYNSYSNLYFQSKFTEEHKKKRWKFWGKVGYKDSQEYLERYPT